jgi:hypothetical protein
VKNPHLPALAAVLIIVVLLALVLFRIDLDLAPICNPSDPGPHVDECWPPRAK